MNAGTKQRNDLKEIQILPPPAHRHLPDVHYKRRHRRNPLASLMTHDLASELKGAGFPQTAEYGTFFYDEQKRHVFIDEDLEGLTWINYVRNPTLSELIEACSPRFKKLQAGVSAFIWRADCYPDENIFSDGSTPEEAVAGCGLR